MTESDDWEFVAQLDSQDIGSGKPLRIGPPRFYAAALGMGELEVIDPVADYAELMESLFDFAAIRDVHAMKRQIRAVRDLGAVTLPGHDVKLGRGGIREVEFFVQTQQLVFGGRRPALRGRRTLAMLAEMGFVDEQAEDGYSLDALLAAGEAAEVPFSVAGGVSADSVEAVQRAGADVAVAGSAIYSASDVAGAAAADAISASQFNEPADAGSEYIIVNYTVTYIGDDADGRIEHRLFGGHLREPRDV